MLRFQLSLIVLFASAGALLTPWWMGSEIAAAAEASARVTTARAAKIAAMSFESQARALVDEAFQAALQGVKAPFSKEPSDQFVRWHLDASGTVIAVYGGLPLKAGMDLSGIEVVGLARQGVASDGIVNLKVQPKPSLWHIAAAPVSDSAGAVAGVVVVGNRLSHSSKRLVGEVKGLTNPVDPSIRLGLIIGERRYGDLPDQVAGKVRRGFPLGEPAGIGQSEQGIFIRLDEAAWMASAQSLQTQAGPGFIVAATDVSTGLAPLGDLLQNGLLASLCLTVLGVVLVLFVGRRLSASANTLAGWLSEWRVGESSPIPLASLKLHPLFRRVRGALDLALEGKRANREPASFLDSLTPQDDNDFGMDTMDFAGLEGSEDYGDMDAPEDVGHDLFGSPTDASDETEVGAMERAIPEPASGPTLPPIPAGKPIQDEMPSAPTGGGINQFKVGDEGALAPQDPAGFGDMATGQFNVPETLLEQISKDEIETQLRPHEETYDEYVAMRRSLGEDTDSITYERFLKKIENTRAKILEETGARDVRFSVKEKNGRASLRAMPMMAP